MKRSLVDRDALADLLAEHLFNSPDLLRDIRENVVAALPDVRPQVVANISGGVLQGASSDYPVDIYALDFDVDSFDEDSTGIEVEGDHAYFFQTSTSIDPDFVRDVMEAPEINFATGEPVDDCKMGLHSWIYDNSAGPGDSCELCGEPYA